MHGRSERAPALLWVRSGVAHLETVRGDARIVAGTAAWVPAGLSYQLRTEAESVVVPVIGNPATPIASITPLDVDAALGDWLLWRFAQSLGFLAPPVNSGPTLDLVVGVSRDGSREAAPGASHPPMPRSSIALQIARGVLRDPRTHDALPAIAAAHAVSVRSVEHAFSQETGMPFGRWRTAVRIASAAQLLAQGHDVGWAAEHSGFRTASGFTRAFRARTGRTPSEFARQSLGARSRVLPQPPAQALHDARPGAAFPGAAAPEAGLPDTGLPASPPAIPSATSWERINDFHVLIWVHRGRARATVGDRLIHLQRGDALWLPAGVRNRVDLDAGAILLPLGSVPGRTGTVPPSPRALRLPAEADDFLLHNAVANYSWIRPQGHDAFRVTRWFLSAIATESEPVAGRPSAAAATVAAETRTHPDAGTSMDEWATALSVPSAQLSREFRAAYGQPFARWRAQLRMTLARQYLEEGMTVREAGQRVGYAHAPAFSRAFTAHHDITPKRYRAKATEAVTELLVR
ncbi:helix-turn-helix transcriptional regulator [Leucobacter japonicus]|uniref:helix-turn-helix transcriptional regulator n=1 Tax=Leucobacter japonicus TaxID=1461259 RepID=UPI00138F5A74|nr:helix-turn-helix domain-containing protein [Leucobacter japonicus]